MTFLLRLLCLCASLLLGLYGAGVLGSGAAQAQVTTEDLLVDAEAWERLADRADQVIEAGRASTPALEEMRAQLVEWRQRFIDAQNVNSNPIATVQSQLNALGPPPEEGEEEPNVARSRVMLNERLADLQAPRKVAELAKNRADGLITGIDKIIRERESEALLTLGPSPVNPANWPAGLTALQNTARAVANEMRKSWNSPGQRATFKANAPAIIGLLGLGLLLILRGRHWTKRLFNWVFTDDPGPLRWIGAFLVSLGSILIPYLGVLSIIGALFLTQMMGVQSEHIVDSAIGPIFAALVTSWLAMRIFPQREARTLPLNLDEAQRQSGRLYGYFLAVAASSYFFVANVSEFSGWSQTAINVLLFPFITLAGLVLLRLARLLQLHCARETSENEEDLFRVSVVKLVALVLATLAIVSPVLAAIGYLELAHFLMFPSLLTLQILAALLVLQRLIVEIYVAITRDREGAVESLVPVLIGMVLVLLALPPVAIAWGMRPAELVDYWTSFRQGFDLGGVRVSPSVFVTLVVVFALGYAATRLLQGALKNTILPKTRLDQGGRNAIVSGTGYIGLFLAALIAITSAGIDLSSIAIVAGALSVGIGFGLRTVVENFVSGIILLIERPISEGDWIEVGGVHGTVRSISVRSTRIETFDRSDVIVPNADLVAGRVTNYTRSSTIGRVIVAVGVAYGTDTRRVETILQEVADAHPMVLANPAPSVLFRGFGASSLDFEIRAILRDVNWVMNVHSDLNHEIARRFAEEGIEIPFAQRDLWLRNPEALTGDRAAPPTAPRPEPVGQATGGGAGQDTRVAGQSGDSAGDGGDR